MEMVLQAKGAGDWIYRGEGAANLVLAYTGSSPRFVGKVLHVHKVSRNGSKCENENDLSPFTMHECLIWKEINDLLLAPNREIAEQMYVQHVMSPLLGSEHVDAGIRVLVAKEFPDSVEKNVRVQHPDWRVNDAKADNQCDSALLLSDLSLFPHSVVKDEFCISVEIKPKCGFLPISKFIAEENSVKRSVTRFKMHQALKFHQGKVSFIDLDMKPLKKMEYYYELDQKIVSCYSQIKKTKHHTVNGAASIEETLCCEQSSAVEDASHVRDSAVIGALYGERDGSDFTSTTRKLICQQLQSLSIPSPYEVFIHTAGFYINLVGENGGWY